MPVFHRGCRDCTPWWNPARPGRCLHSSLTSNASCWPKARGSTLNSEMIFLKSVIIVNLKFLRKVEQDDSRKIPRTSTFKRMKTEPEIQIESVGAAGK